MIVEIRGNILDTDCKLIAHGVNCQNKMGSGVAKALYEKWPIIKVMYHDYFEEFDAGESGEKFLGKIDCVSIDRNTGKTSRNYNLVLVNCFTQQNYGYDGALYLDYKALENCLKELKELCKYYQITEIAMPKIGCGLAGGDWEEVRKIIDNCLPDLTVKVYSLE